MSRVLNRDEYQNQDHDRNHDKEVATTIQRIAEDLREDYARDLLAALDAEGVRLEEGETFRVAYTIINDSGSDLGDTPDDRIKSCACYRGVCRPPGCK